MAHQIWERLGILRSAEGREDPRRLAQSTAISIAVMFVLMAVVTREAGILIGVVVGLPIAFGTITLMSRRRQSPH